MNGNRRPSPRRRQVDLDAVRSDDVMLDALGQSDAVPDDDELAAMLGAWRADLDTEPLPPLRYDALAPEPADAAGDWAPGPPAAGKRSRRTTSVRPRTVRLAVAAALIIATAGGVSVAAAGAQPSDALWPVVKIVHPHVANQRSAQDAIGKARQAMDEHRYDDARQLIARADALVAKVSDPAQAQRLRDQLNALRAALPAATPGGAPASPSPHSASSPSQTPTPTPTASPAATGANPSPPYSVGTPTLSPSSGKAPGGLLPSLLPSLPPLLPSLPPLLPGL
ncbi:hypothetical protein GCM10023322_73700 [Rugosimonospora acidiphila]|uniref:Anti-sigma-D factor RsdA sigma factor binding region domain-containing protein n=1 Tax=Rugosimonospora acidiphila TaxID=556531 RepID=A0ABP9SPP8_9ACTN